MSIPSDSPSAVSPTLPTESSTPTFTAIPPLSADEWQTLPVIPEVFSRVKEIYTRGQSLGNNPNAFSKIGDCGSTPAWFLGDFDRGPRFYALGEYTELDAVIQAFQGSYERTSLAAKAGFNASSVFSLIWSDRTQCNANETPLACEYRVHNPAYAFITLGSNDVYHQDTFEKQLRAIIEFSIEQGVIPILSTKADNLEGDGSLNAQIAQLAHEYEVPLWNYWLAVQSLPDQGLQEDQVHLTWGPNQFDDSQAMKSAWTIRNLTALQSLDIVWRSVTSQLEAQTLKP
ncbi:MAG TPA: SGNH/GDSL hydrolase family protein [Anaerolineales bacterium]|nr:SGNH/GDSL hydrolase family protein [Anaerolineales bacterium]